VWAPIAPGHDQTGAFIESWQSGPRRADHIRTVVITPGLFAEFLPRCLAPAVQMLRAAGYRVVRTPARSRHGVRDHAALIAAELTAALQPGERFLWCGHSKGAIDLLYVLETTPALRESCTGAVVVQSAAGPSRVIERWQNAPRGIGERVRRQVIRHWLVRDGVRDISQARDPLVSEWLGRFVPAVPTLCVVSWSLEPTSWVDSYHRTLEEMAPGQAHDGQFLLQDQRLPGTNLVCLPHVDHAQPMLGGSGFDVARFWRTLVETALFTPALPSAQTR
jgi:hypothetical protein